MLKTLIVTASLIGSASAFGAEINRAQILNEFKADISSSCLEKREELRDFTLEPEAVTAEVCQNLTEHLVSDSPTETRSILPVFDMILEKNDEELKNMRSEIMRLEEHFDALEADTIIARTPLINLINKMLNR